MNRFLFCLLGLFVTSSQAFVPPSRGALSPNPVPQQANHNFYTPPSLVRQRQSVAPIQTMGLFGLGAPEIAVILVAAAFLLGPQKLAELGKDAGKIAGELKEVPKEFQKGLEEGEQQAKTIKQKTLEENKE
eukprot:scaffold34620_cov160-Amphora_coffeaeformis.AAC.7